MRRSITLAAALGLTLSLAACSGTPADDETTTDEAKDTSTLTIWVDDTRAEAVQAVADTFTEENGTKFELVQKDFADIKDEFIAQAPTGKGPDLIVGANDWVGTLVQNGVVEPLDLGDKAGDFLDVTVEGLSQDGVLYGLPYAFENIGLVRNTDLVPDAPTGSFDELIAQGQALVAEGKATYPVLIQVGEGGDAYHMYPIQTSFGSVVFGKDDKGNYDPTQLKIGDEAGQAFAAYLGKLGADGIVNADINGDAARDIFAEGKSPFMITGAWYVPAFTDAGIKVAVSEIPSAGGQPAQPMVGVQGFFLSSKSENKLVGQKFIDYLATAEAQDTLFEIGGRAPAIEASFEKAKSDPIIGGFGAAGAIGAVQPSIAAMGVVWEDWGLAEKAIITGSDPASTWTAAATSIQSKIDAG